VKRKSSVAGRAGGEGSRADGIGVELDRLARLALAEDVGAGDCTAVLIPAAARARGLIIARGPGVAAGLEMAAAVFRNVDPPVVFRPRVREGQGMAAGTAVAEVSGPARSILTAERTALNFLGRLSGIATLTRIFVMRAGGRPVIYDTRKTTPGLRRLEKAAVRAGGGRNHRFGLFDGILIKDNHISACTAFEKVKRPAAIRLLLAGALRAGLPVEVEVENRAEALAAARGGAGIIMLDNFSPERVLRTIPVLRRAGYRGQIEVSGGIGLENLAEYAVAGADRISIGRLTHSAPALDFSLEISGWSLPAGRKRR